MDVIPNGPLFVRFLRLSISVIRPLYILFLKRQWMDTGKGAVTKAFFPISKEQATTKNSNIPRVDNNANRTWENKFILIQIWTNR